MAEIPEFKGEFSGLAPNSPTPLSNKNLCPLVWYLLSVLSPQSSLSVCGLWSAVRRSGLPQYLLQPSANLFS